MEMVTITLLSHEPHLSQILTGFTMLARQRKLRIQIQDSPEDAALPYRSAMLVVAYRGKTLVYDMLDGYQHEDAIRYHLTHSDYYFKRSFSESKNAALALDWEGKMFPLGFNYHVSCVGHPLDRPFWKEKIKEILHMENYMWSSTWFSPGKFEQRPQKCTVPQVLFLTRLWADDASMPEHLREERQQINRMRMDIIRQMRAMEGDIHFVGGLPDTDLARSTAPDLIMPSELTERRNYVKCLRRSDICIGSMGLFESIGWKTGEYVAAAKAIINERFHYTVPGNFEKGTNYLEFETTEQCIRQVETLAGDSERIYRMKCQNREYYLNYLRPDKLVGNTLAIVDERLSLK